MSPVSSQAQLHGFTVLKGDDPPVAHVGDTITATWRVRNEDQANDAIVITNVYNVISYPPPCGVVTNIVPVPGASLLTITNQFTGTTFTVLGRRLAIAEFFDVQNTFVVLNCDGTYGFLPDLAVAEGYDTRDRAGGSPLASINSNPAGVEVRRPSLAVYKQVVCYSNGACEPFNADLNTQKSATGVRIDPPNAANCPAFCYRITVRNTGNTPLTLTVSDASAPGPNLDLSGCGFPAVLDVGATAQCVIPAVTHCDNTVNVVTANGVDDLGQTVTARDTNNVTVRPLAISCELQVNTGSGFVTPAPGACVTQRVGQPYTVRVRVTNTGQHPLQNVTVTSIGGLEGCLPTPRNLGGLAVNETKTIDCEFTCDAVRACVDYAVAVSGEASQSPDHACDFNAQGQRIVARSECRTRVECGGEPRIEVLKEVACYLPGDNCGPFGKVATGVKDSACPAFCYRVTVRNVGDVPITTLTVTDPVLGGDISSLFGPLPIAVGDSRTATIKPIVHCVDTPDTVTANGQSADGQSTTDQDSAEARVLVINIECESVLFAAFDMDENTNDCRLVLPEGFSGTVRYTLTLRNTGTAGLDITALTGVPTLVNCDDGTPVTVPLPIHLDAGGVYTLTACIDVACPTNLNFAVKAHAEASDNNGTLCVYDRNGQRIFDDTSDNDCVCSITCRAPVTCRVTGGGVLLPGFVDQSCIDVNTTIFPFTSPNGLTIKKITHGGQLGAPFSQMDCGAILGNPCIRGQWQHVRHYEGTANPRDVFDMNFHSVTPKGQFDSLSCVCLGCCDPETGAFIPPTLGPLVHKFQLCNPDDHKVCGPQPRPAPANAIIWSGVGRITPTDDVRGSRAAQAEWVIFRVYIEDRSEPGGGHPKGAVEPADIYCFQAWKTGIKVSKKPDFTTLSVAFRQALGQANCEFLEGLEAGLFPIGTLPSPTVNGLTADIQDCGPMHDGNHQIHPSTSATCEQ